MLSTSHPASEIFRANYEYVRPAQIEAEELKMVSNFDGLFTDLKKLKPKDVKRTSVNFSNETADMFG